MEDILSFLGVIALWLALSIGFWGLNRWLLHRKRRRQRALLAEIGEKVREAQTIFDRIRSGAARPPAPEETAQPEALIRQETTALLRRVQDEGGYFDNVRALSMEMRKRLGIEDCPPLSEVLQIRRDLWAASEIVLVEDLKTLGDAFTDEDSYRQFCGEAQRLLFKGAAERAGEEDHIDLRLALARTDVVQFAAGVEEDLRTLEEKERLPSWREIISYPIAALRALPGQIRLIKAALLEQIEQVKLAARAIRESETFMGALAELRRARAELPGRFAASLEKAAALARHGRESIAAHHAFLIKAYDLQTKYEDWLSRAPELTERGRQFIARLELAKRSERLRVKSKGLIDELRRLIVKGLAHLIAALQRLQERLAAPEPLAAAGPAEMPRLPHLTRRETAKGELAPYRSGAQFSRFREAPAEKTAGKEQEKTPVETHIALLPPPPRPDKKPEEGFSEAALTLLRSLFFDRRLLKRAAQETRLAPKAKPESVKPEPPERSRTAAADAPPPAETLAALPPPAPKPAIREKAKTGKPRSLWPILDKLREPPGAPAKESPDDPLQPQAREAEGSRPARAPQRKPEYEKPEAAEPQSQPPAAPKPKSVGDREPEKPAIEVGEPITRTRRFGFLRRKTAEAASPAGPPPAARTGIERDARKKKKRKDQIDASDTLAKLLQRLSEEELAVIAEIRPADEAKPSRRVSSLISKLSAIETGSAFDEKDDDIRPGAAAAKTPEAAAADANVAAAAANVKAKAMPSSRFAFFGRRKGS